MIRRVRDGIQDLFDEGIGVSQQHSLRTTLAEDLLIELFGGWNDAQDDEPHGRQLVDILLALGVRPPDTAIQPKEDGAGRAGEVEDPEILHEALGVIASVDAGHAAQERRGHGGDGHEDSE